MATKRPKSDAADGYAPEDGPRPSEKLTPREEFRMLVRQRIITASMKCFEAGGYGATTMEEIAKEAHISRTAIYQHFKYKSEILYEAVSQTEPQWLSVFIEAFPLHWDSRDHVRAGTAKVFELYRDNTAFLAVILEAASIEPNVSNWLESAFQKHVSGILDKLVGDSLKTPVAKEHFYIRIWISVTAMDNVFRRVLDPRWSLDEQAAIDEIARMWIGVMEVSDDDFLA